MTNGKKSNAEAIVYGAMDRIGEQTGKPPVDVLEQAVKTVTPVLEVKSRRVGGANYQVPVEVPQRRARTLAVPPRLGLLLPAGGEGGVGPPPPQERPRPHPPGRARHPARRL